MARISLVMPNYNHGRFIVQALDALVAQTRPADEILVIDDASTDDSIEIIEGFARRYPVVTLVRHEQRRGALHTLNEGLQRARGDLISFPAADDLVEAEFLERSERLLQRFPAAPFCSACVALIDADGGQLGIRPILRPMLKPGFAPAEEARTMLTRGDNFFLGNVTLYRRERLVGLGGFDPSLQSSADGMMMRRMAVRWGFCFIPEILGMWRLHGANLSATSVTVPDMLESMIKKNGEVIAAESPDLFPASYARAFERRLRFNAARVLLSQRDSGARGKGLRNLLQIVRATGIDSAVLRLLRLLGSAGRKMSVIWLALRLRPFSFVWFGKERLRRFVSGPPRRPQRAADQ